MKRIYGDGVEIVCIPKHTNMLCKDNKLCYWGNK